MENARPTVDIDQNDLYNLATALGLLTKAFEDWDKELFVEPHDLEVPAMLVAVFLLDRSLGGDILQAAWSTFLDVTTKRRILPGSPKEVVWPSWDLETLRHPELTVIHDIGIMLAAWNYAAKQDELPPEMFLGPLFSLSGAIAEGVERGYLLQDEKVAASYEEQRRSLAKSHGGEDAFKSALKAQLQSIDEALQNQRKKSQN